MAILLGATVHNNSSLTNIQKLNHLQAQLQHDAARVVAGFPLTGVNYEHSVTILRQRYDQLHKMINALHDALFEMHAQKIHHQLCNSL